MNKILNIKRVGSLARARAMGYTDVVYVGRRNATYNVPESPLHNPVPLRDETLRDKNIAEYEQYLRDELITGNEAIWNALKQIGPDTTLMCWCSPKRCHAEVIAKIAAEIQGRSYQVEYVK